MSAPFIDGYWFAASDVLPNGDGRKIVVGKTLTVDPPIELCVRGLHASVRPLDALKYLPGPLLYKVRLSGQILRDEDKMCATERTALAVVDATDLLQRFACRQALSVIHLWDAPDIVRRYLIGNNLIRTSAGDAALAAARNASSATSRDAAWSAWAATRATRAGIWDATSTAALAATSRDAAIDAANTMLTEMISEVLR